VPRRNPPEEFAVVLGWEGEDAILTVHGDIDMASGPELWDYIDATLSTKPARLVLDLAPVTFMDSVGLNTIVKTYKRLQDSGDELVLRAPSRNAMRVLEIVGLADMVPIEAKPA
jgi:anti-anti-sigma factor